MCTLIWPEKSASFTIIVADRIWSLVRFARNHWGRLVRRRHIWNSDGDRLSVRRVARIWSLCDRERRQASDNCWRRRGTFRSSNRICRASWKECRSLTERRTRNRREHGRSTASNLVRYRPCRRSVLWKRWQSISFVFAKVSVTSSDLHPSKNYWCTSARESWSARTICRCWSQALGRWAAGHNEESITCRKSGAEVILADNWFHSSRKTVERRVGENCTDVELRYCSYREYSSVDQDPNRKRVSWHTVEECHSQKLTKHPPNDTDGKVSATSCSSAPLLLRWYMAQRSWSEETNGAIRHAHIRLCMHQDQILHKRRELRTSFERLRDLSYRCHQLAKGSGEWYRLDQRVPTAIEGCSGWLPLPMNHFDSHMPSYCPIPDDLVVPEIGNPNSDVCELFLQKDRLLTFVDTLLLVSPVTFRLSFLIHQLLDHFQLGIDRKCPCRELMLMLNEEPIERCSYVIMQRRLIRQRNFRGVGMKEIIFDQSIEQTLTHLIATLSELKNNACHLKQQQQQQSVMFSYLLIDSFNHPWQIQLENSFLRPCQQDNVRTLSERFWTFPLFFPVAVLWVENHCDDHAPWLRSFHHAFRSCKYKTCRDIDMVVMQWNSTITYNRSGSDILNDFTRSILASSSISSRIWTLVGRFFFFFLSVSMVGKTGWSSSSSE